VRICARRTRFSREGNQQSAAVPDFIQPATAMSKKRKGSKALHIAAAYHYPALRDRVIGHYASAQTPLDLLKSHDYFFQVTNR
jgi:hypothetical protein